MRALGAEVEELGPDELIVHGVGLRGLRAPAEPIDCGNAGTLARLLPGLLAFQDGTLHARRRRVALAPADAAHRRAAAADGRRRRRARGAAAAAINGGALTGIDYTLPVASAQVKSVVLLAGLGAVGRTTVVEPLPSRDHTELMLQAAGGRIVRRPTSVSVDPADSLSLGTVDVPGDFSSAAPFIVAATLVPGSQLTIHDVGLNPRRTGLLDVLERMGARIGIVHRRRRGHGGGGRHRGELGRAHGDRDLGRRGPAADRRAAAVRARGGLRARRQRASPAPRELRAEGERPRRDRRAPAPRGSACTRQGQPDGFSSRAFPPVRRAGGRGRGDHRIAMLGAVAGLISREGVEIEGAESVGVSFPGFFELLEQLTQR